MKQAGNQAAVGEGSILKYTRDMDNYINELSGRLTELESGIADILCSQVEQVVPEGRPELSQSSAISNLAITLKTQGELIRIQTQWVEDLIAKLDL